MNTNLKVKALIIISGLVLSFTSIAQDNDVTTELEIEKASLNKKEFLEKDPGLSDFFDGSYGYAILPSVGKGGLIVGGAHGKGVVYQGNVPMGLTEMTQVTVGAQIGGKAYSEVIFFKTEAEYEVFISGRYEVAAQVSAVAATEGVSKELDYSDGVIIVTMDKGGLMAEVSVGGQKFTYTSL